MAWNIVQMVLSEVALVVAAGGAVGLVVAIAAGRGIESQLFGLKGFDPVVFVVAPLVLVSVAALAATLPAIRAARIEPLTALRHE